MEKTLILLKPDAVQRNLSGEIIKILEQTGYKIIGMKFMILPLEKANDVNLDFSFKLTLVVLVCIAFSDSSNIL